MDALLLKTEELITIKQSTHQRMHRMRQLSQAVQEWKQQWERFQQDFSQPAGILSPEAAIDRINQFIRHSNEFIQDFDLRIHRANKALEHDHRVFSGLINDLLQETKNTSLMPFSGLLTVFPRMVREIAKDRGKLVDFKVAGESVEIDKRILEGIKDPLIHLVRNAIDHGIEVPEIRTTAGKPAVGTIHLTVSQPENNQVCLKITDDGNGIDVEAIKADAVKKGIISDADAAALTDEAALKLAFHSGVSSSRMITEISGRGLGMSIVQEALDDLGGRMAIASEPAAGTVFTIHLPVTLATFRGILIEVAGHLFILPNAQVCHTLNIRPETIKTAENRPIISFEERPTSLVSLADVLGLPKIDQENLHDRKKPIPAVIMENGTSQIAFYVDKVILEQEVLVKPLGNQLKKVRHFSGATILGTGQVVLILNPKDLIKTAAGQSLPAVQPAEPATVATDQPKSVLIVEDSFTSRTLLKNILEASGYDIKTAIDGKDAWAQLQSRRFDAVVSDIEMPRMTGFELTTSIRADKSLAELPVILVTSLDSPADRERGVEVGADAYIVKSSFDQSNLLEVLGRFV